MNASAIAKGQPMTEKPVVKLQASEAEIPAAVSAPEALALAKRLIRLADLFTLIDVKKATGHRLIAAGKIGPPAIRLTSATVRYDAVEVDA